MSTPEVDIITKTALVTELVRLLTVVENRQQRDEAKNIDAGIFWEGYQAALHDLLHVLDAEPNALNVVSP